jgi:SNF2 family DNA or RNA helicase
MQIVDNRAVLLNLRDPTKVTTVIPKSKQVSDSGVLVKWGLDEALVLKNLNINVPSPIQATYEWPGLHKPFAHQIETSSFLTVHKKCFCFSDMGTGKTASAVWASDYLLQQGKVNRVLVICPLSIMSSAWKADLFKFAMHRTVDIAYHKNAAKRKQIIADGAEYVIINYDGIQIVRDEIAAGGFDLIIVDEATHYKNPRTARWKVLHSLIKSDTWLWLMTGTPAAQSPLDAYGLAKIVNPTSVPRFYGSYRDMVMIKVTQFKWMPKPNATDIVHDILQPAIRFTKDECLDLPEMVYVHRDVEMSPQQRRYYEKLRKDMVIEAAEKQVTAVNAAVNMNKLLQLSCGAIYTDDKEVLEFDVKKRYKVLKEVIDESSKKVLVFVPFKHVTEILTEKLVKDGISTAVITGSVSVGKRTDIFNRFQTEADPRVLLIQPKAAAHGVTLTAANTVVWWGPTSSLETYLQANARVHRTGQDHRCTVVHLQSSNVEKHVYATLGRRIDAHSKILDLYKKILE